MTRRNYLKSTFILLAFGILGTGLFKWMKFRKPFSIADLLEKKSLIEDITELIIPETDTPGAKTAGVASYIINVLKNCTGQFTLHSFMSGLMELEEYAKSNYGKPFRECNLKEKSDTLYYFDNHSGFRFNILNKINNKLFGRPFFILFKDLTVQGYCSSMLGATQGLAYDYIPGNFLGCISKETHQKSWATK